MCSSDLFTEISGYSRSELIGKELSIVTPHLFVENGTNCFDFSSEKHDHESFIKNKSNNLTPITYEAIPRLNGQWHVILKLSTSHNNKIIFLADEAGKITDYNLVALNIFKNTEVSLQ